MTIFLRMSIILKPTFICAVSLIVQMPMYFLLITFFGGTKATFLLTVFAIGALEEWARAKAIIWVNSEMSSINVNFLLQIVITAILFSFVETCFGEKAILLRTGLALEGASNVMLRTITHLSLFMCSAIALLSKNNKLFYIVVMLHGFINVLLNSQIIFL